MKKQLSGPSIDLAIVAERTILAGRRGAEADLSRILRELRNLPEASVVAIDLGGVEVLSSSYFLGGLWPLWRPLEGLQAEIYPLLANAGEPVLEEIEFVLEHSGGLVWHVAGLGRSVTPTLLGQPDVYDEALFDLLMKRGTLTAKEAHESDPSIGLTAWSSRLGQQHQSRLLRREKKGKEMHYSLPWVAIDG